MLLKCAILGKSGVGKTSIFQRLMGLNYSDQQSLTINATFVCKTFIIDGQEVRVDIWDTAGQERYASMSPMYYRDAQAVVVIFDISEDSSFQGAKRIIQEVRDSCQDLKTFMLLGNKCDVDVNRAVSAAEINKYVESSKISCCFEVSSKENTNIQQSFSKMVQLAIANEQLRLQNYMDDNTEQKKVDKNDVRKNMQCC